MKAALQAKHLRSPRRPNLAGSLIDDLRHLIHSARSGLVQAVNTALVGLYWQIGHRINAEILKQRRAQYGDEILSTLSKQLSAEFGKGYSVQNLYRMIRLAIVYADPNILSTLSRELSWSHLMEILPLDGDLERDFYVELCRIEGWSVRTLREKIDGMLYQRTALSRKPEQLVRKELSALRSSKKLSPAVVLRDPYVLDFLGLRDTFAERDFEAAILREIESFLLELGTGFAFMARQKRITLDGDDYYIDLLFYHRLMRRLVVVELKIGEFKPAYKGTMELYLRWLDRFERKEDEERPIGLILCAGKKAETVEVLGLEDSGIHVAQYLTELPPRDVLAKRLHEAIQTARQRLESENSTQATGRRRRLLKSKEGNK